MIVWPTWTHQGEKLFRHSGFPGTIFFSSQDSFGDFFKQCGQRLEKATALVRQAEEGKAQALSDLFIQLQKLPPISVSTITVPCFTHSKVSHVNPYGGS